LSLLHLVLPPLKTKKHFGKIASLDCPDRHILCGNVSTKKIWAWITFPRNFQVPKNRQNWGTCMEETRKNHIVGINVSPTLVNCRIVEPSKDTTDGRNPAPVEYGTYLIIYKVLYILGGCFGFLPSTGINRYSTKLQTFLLQL